MPVHLALRTLHAMDHSMRADQGQAYRAHLKAVLPEIHDAYRGSDEGFRSHLGASVLGGECDRALWYSWRWFTRSSFSGQILRLFNRGHLEEGRFIALMLTIGCKVWQQDEHGKQFRISHMQSHIGGSGDGVIGNLPDLGEVPCLGEFKTHNEKSFHQLAGGNWRKYLEFTFGESTDIQVFEGEGVKLAKFEHYVQMQLYMFKMGLTVGLYVACNKNTDEIYCELVPLDAAVAELFLARGERIVNADHPPAKISKSPGFFKCRFCDHKPVCHLSATPERNCRSCVYSVPNLLDPGARWTCSKLEHDISKEIQLVGCGLYTPRQ